jgi:hypothetical protein
VHALEGENSDVDIAGDCTVVGENVDRLTYDMGACGNDDSRCAAAAITVSVSATIMCTAHGTYH